MGLHRLSWLLVHRYIVTREFFIIVQTNEPNKKIRTDSKSVETRFRREGKLQRGSEKWEKREWWGDRSVAKRDERVWWGEDSGGGGLQRRRKRRQTGRMEVMGASGWAPEMNTGEICKLSYSNVEDPHWALSQLVELPAVTSFCKLTQNPATETFRLN